MNRFENDLCYVLTGVAFVAFFFKHSEWVQFGGRDTFCWGEETPLSVTRTKCFAMEVPSFIRYGSSSAMQFKSKVCSVCQPLKRRMFSSFALKSVQYDDAAMICFGGQTDGNDIIRWIRGARLLDRLQSLILKRLVAINNIGLVKQTNTWCSRHYYILRYRRDDVSHVFILNT